MPTRLRSQPVNSDPNTWRTRLFCGVKFDDLQLRGYQLQGSSDSRSFLQPRNRNAARIPSRMMKLNLDARPVRTKRESLRPLDDHNRILSQSILEPQRFEVVKIFDAIQIHVINLAMILKHVNEGECRTGDFLFLRCSQPANDSLGQRSLPAAKVSGQQDKDGWLQ